MHPLLPGTGPPVTTEAMTEADQRHAIPRPRGQHPPEAPMPTKRTPTRSPLSGRPGRKSSSTSIPGREVEPLGRQFQTSRRSSIAQQWTRTWRLCHSSLMSPPGHVRHHLQNLLLHITSLEEPMRSTCQKRSHANEGELVQETIEQPSTWRKCRSIFTLKTRRLWTKESLCQDFQNSSCLRGMPHLE